MLALALAALTAGGCSASLAEPDATAPQVLRIPVTIDTETGAKVFQAEIADTPEERARGLMKRTSMGEDEGMLFLFGEEQQLSFWMRETFIPLDMIFIRGDRTILGVVENAEPRTDTSRRVPGLSQFVLEINGGLAAKLGIKAGQTVSFYAPLPER